MKRLTALLVLAILLILAIPVMAQDATVEPATSEVIATVEAAPITVISGEGEGTTINVEAPDNAPAPAPSVEVHPLLQVAIGFSVVLAAISFAFEKLGNRASKAINTPYEVATVEKLGDSTPSVVVLPITAALERTTKALENITALWKEATDRVPQSTKVTPPANSSVSSTGGNFTTNG